MNEANFGQDNLEEDSKPNNQNPIIESEYLKRLDQLKSMARVVGEDFDMAVDIGKKRGWQYIFYPVNKIEVDPVDIKEKGIEYCFGVICHEGSHRKISRIDFIPKKIWQKRGFAYLMNAVEDPRVNNWVSGKYAGAKDWLEKVYDDDFSVERTITKTTQEKIGYVPKHTQFGLEIIKYWHSGAFSDDLPQEVKEALEKTIKYAELAYQNYPQKDPEEKEISQIAKDVYRIVYAAIWPEYQKLVDKSLDQESLRQMVKDMLENGEIELNNDQQSQDGEPLPLDQLPEDLQEEIKKKLKEKLDSMSEEEKEKFQEKAKKQAEQNLDELEEKENQELTGKFVEQPDSKLEEEKKKKQETEDAEAEKKRQEELAKVKKEIEEKLEKGKSEYDRAYQEVQPFIEKLADEISNLFITQRWPRYRKGFPGQKLRLAGAMKYATQGNYQELFETREKLERKNYNFLLLVDLSGSMSGDKIEETFKGVVLFMEALNRVASTLGGVKVSVYGFQDDLIKYKLPEDILDDNLRNKISVMKKEVSNSGTHNQSNYNNDGFCLDKAAKILSQEKKGNNFLFVLSDGEPAGDVIHHLEGFDSSSQEEELHYAIKTISQDGNIHLLGIGLGSGTEHVANFYSEKLANVENIPSVDVKTLCEVLTKKLEDLVK